MFKKYFTLTLSILLVTISISNAATNFEKYFVDKTMRVDFFHTGTKGKQVISLDQVYEEPIVQPFNKKMWAGNTKNLLDTLNLGKYIAKVIDVKTNQLIYSRGFCSLYGEWETTGEAEKGIYRTFHESVLIPFPRNTVQFIIAVRDKENYFHDIFSTVIDPNSRFVSREGHDNIFKTGAVFKSGHPHNKVDLVILADGYSKKEMKLFHEDINRLTQVLFSTSPFKERKSDFNVWFVESLSRDSGIDEPRQNKWKDNILGASYNSFDSPRYVLSDENRKIRDIASLVPYDQIYLVVNSERYGGGGIFNLYSTCYARDKGKNRDWWPEYVFVHEFGHAFAGLGDEYYSSSVAYNEFYPLGVDPWEPNVGIIKNGHIKWENYVEKDTPIPTPWGKAEYDSLGKALGELDRSAKDYRESYKKIYEQRNALFQNQKHRGKVGAFEGSGYASEGLYRPYIDCIMFSKSLVGFCPVCGNAIERMINFHTE